MVFKSDGIHIYIYKYCFPRVNLMMTKKKLYIRFKISKYWRSKYTLLFFNWKSSLNFKGAISSVSFLPDITSFSWHPNQIVPSSQQNEGTWRVSQTRVPTKSSNSSSVPTRTFKFDREFLQKLQKLVCLPVLKCLLKIPKSEHAGFLSKYF